MSSIAQVAMHGTNAFYGGEQASGAAARVQSRLVDLARSTQRKCKAIGELVGSLRPDRRAALAAETHKRLDEIEGSADSQAVLGVEAARVKVRNKTFQKLHETPPDAVDAGVWQAFGAMSMPERRKNLERAIERRDEPVLKAIARAPVYLDMQGGHDEIPIMQALAAKWYPDETAELARAERDAEGVRVALDRFKLTIDDYVRADAPDLLPGDPMQAWIAARRVQFAGTPRATKNRANPSPTETRDFWAATQGKSAAATIAAARKQPDEDGDRK